MKYMTKAEEIVEKILSMVPIKYMEDDYYKEIVKGCVKEVEKLIDPLGTSLRGKEEIRHKEKLYPSDWDIY
jgi:hypothetical protein